MREIKMTNTQTQVKTILDSMDWEQAERKEYIDSESALIPYNNPELLTDLDLGQLFIFIHRLQNDTFSISLTAQDILDETDKASLYGEPNVEFYEDEKQLIIGKFLEVVE
jgi:hypothetical protein